MAHWKYECNQELRNESNFGIIHKECAVKKKTQKWNEIIFRYLSFHFYDVIRDQATDLSGASSKQKIS